MPEKYSKIDGLAGFGFLVNALDQRDGRTSDGDKGASFPRSDAEDISRGTRFIPGEVTIARRRGEKVQFMDECGPNCWYWLMPDDSRIYHYDSMTYDSIGTANGRKRIEEECGSSFENGAGPCPSCGNVNTNGGTVKP